MKNEILTYLDQNFITQGKIYTDSHIPYQISHAIYLYGSDQIKNVIAFIDTSDIQDGSTGMIFTDTHLYYQFDYPYHFAYQDIISLSLEKHRHDISYKGIIKTSTQKLEFKDIPIHIDQLFQMLSAITHKDIEMILTLHEKIDYYVSLILDDIVHDAYEDVVLTPNQKNTIKELNEELEVIHRLDDSNYQYELECLCPKALQFFDELELESDEIDILLDIQKQLDNNNSQNFDQAQAFYDDMMKRYQQGDTSLFDQMQGMMDKLGIHLDDFKNKSPDELDQYINELCQRFGISREQLDAMTQKYR